MPDDLILVERDAPIATVLLNRPRQLNALSDELMDDLVATLAELDRDDAVRCIVLGGSERAFAAGARRPAPRPAAAAARDMPSSPAPAGSRAPLETAV